MFDDATAIVLAGGNSTRMGQDKALLPWRGAPLIAHIVAQLKPHFEEVLISTAKPDQFAFLDIRIAPDREPGQGPLMGLASGLAASNSDRNFVMACDMPNVPVPLVNTLLALPEYADCAVPRTVDGEWEPLFAVYRKRLLPQIDLLYDTGYRGLKRLVERCQVEACLIPQGALINLNTMEEYVQHHGGLREEAG